MNEELPAHTLCIGLNCALQTDRLKSELLPTRAQNGLWKHDHCRCELNKEEIGTEKSVLCNLLWVQIGTCSQNKDQSNPTTREQMPKATRKRRDHKWAVPRRHQRAHGPADTLTSDLEPPETVSVT